jgi:hypothetical protein
MEILELGAILFFSEALPLSADAWRCRGRQLCVHSVGINWARPKLRPPHGHTTIPLLCGFFYLLSIHFSEIITKKVLRYIEMVIFNFFRFRHHSVRHSRPFQARISSWSVQIIELFRVRNSSRPFLASNERSLNWQNFIYSCLNRWYFLFLHSVS